MLLLMNNPFMTPQKITAGKCGITVAFEWLLFGIYRDGDKHLSSSGVEDADEYVGVAVSALRAESDDCSIHKPVWVSVLCQSVENESSWPNAQSTHSLGLGATHMVVYQLSQKVRGQHTLCERNHQTAYRSRLHNNT